MVLININIENKVDFDITGETIKSDLGPIQTPIFS